MRFLIVGAINTLSGLAVIFALKWLLGLNDLLANLIGYAAGLAISHSLHGRWTFSYGGSLSTRAGRFLAVVLTAYLANLAIVAFVIFHAGLNSYLAQVAGVIPYTVICYFGFRFYVYREHHV